MVLLITAVIAVLGFVTLVFFGKSRTFVIDAQTTAATLTFEGENNNWYLAGAKVCRLRDQPDFTRTASDPACDSRFYDISTQRDITLQWPHGSKAELALTNEGILRVILVTDGPQELSGGTVFVVPSTQWADSGALTFSANMVVGKPISSGERFYLTDGRWQAREAGLITSFLRSNVTEIIKTGDLLRGSTVSVRSDGKPALMNGHITPTSTSAPPGLKLVALSHPGDVELHVGYPGTDVPTIIRPDLVDVALSSPLLLSLAVILSVLASLSQVFADLSSRRAEEVNAKKN
ncbi:hypothetical protein [Sulfitobacter sp. 915]|uniref:hypothetical protein n=1 Tax=Sulfitobacter sp. 915 TaxID=3368558 RepID=UPI0037488772